MAASLNRVFLIGNLTRDPEVRYAPSGQSVVTFTLASNRAYKLPSGETKEEVSFVRIVVWGRRGEVCGQYLSKGSPVFVEGRLQSRSWETQDGQKRSSIEVIASNVQFLGRGKGQSSDGQAPITPLADPAPFGECGASPQGDAIAAKGGKEQADEEYQAEEAPPENTETSSRLKPQEEDLPF